MNFYDEEITINGPSLINLSKVRMESISSERDVSESGEVMPSSSRALTQHGFNASGNFEEAKETKRSIDNVELHKVDSFDNGMDELSDLDSEEEELINTKLGSLPSKPLMREKPEETSTINLEIIQNLDVNQGLKDLFRYILKYTPQNIETPYQLQPFIPDFVPAVGDVDAFLKVTTPELLLPPHIDNPQLSEHLPSLGLRLLDEPSGTQSEPRLLNIKLNTMFSSGNNTLSASQGLAPIARNVKDIDKWINEVEQMHMLRSLYKAQPTKDIDHIDLNWPKTFQDETKQVRLQNAYRLYTTDKMNLMQYVRELCNILDFENISELMPQTAYIQNIYTIFCLYLVTHKAWN